jgi:hypothetical protein
MTIYDERERAAERQYVLMAEKPFRNRARRDKMLASWVATLLGRDIARCLEDIIEADFARGDEGVLKKLESDLAILGLSDTRNLIRHKMQKCFADAVRDVEGSVNQ